MTRKGTGKGEKRKPSFSAVDLNRGLAVPVTQWEKKQITGHARLTCPGCCLGGRWKLQKEKVLKGNTDDSLGELNSTRQGVRGLQTK